ncbi:MAG: trypsin-like peptidase domain-containing protein [bacterium]|nr:trypsin-like peptidase domain-containing protein [bacterium]
MNNNNNQLGVIIATSALTAVLVMLVGLGIVSENREKIGTYLLAGAHNAASETNTIQTPASQSSVVKAVEKSNPAVVSIVVTKDVPTIERYNGSPYDLFEEFFGTPSPQQPRSGGTEERQVGGGSGFFVTADGLIVTNKHVVDDPDAEYTVFTNDGKKHSARVIARDPSLDIALIRIENGSYPYLNFASSKDLDLGQTVIAIGNALGEFENTVSVGVVSGLSRSIVAGSAFGQAEQLDEVIQTDAAINPGNSGGPLLDMNGNVIGVNVAVAAGSQNIGFALPSDMVKVVVDSVKSTGKISRPYIGVRYVPITEAVQQAQNLPVDYGVLVSSDANQPAVIAGSPAAKAGIKADDIILQFDGINLTSERQLATVIRSKKVGDTIPVKILRAGSEQTLEVTLEEYPN